MINKKVHRIISLIIFSIIGLIAAYIFVLVNKEQVLNENRKLVFCNELKPGMDMSEIRIILNRYGSYQEIPLTVNNFTYGIHIVYYDPDSLEMFGKRDIILSVNNDRFIAAMEPVPGDMDMQRKICDN